MKFSPEQIIELISEFAEEEGIQVELDLEKHETHTDGIVDCVVKPVSFVLQSLPIVKIFDLVKALENLIGHLDAFDLKALKAIIMNDSELRQKIRLVVLDYVNAQEMKAIESEK